MEYVEGTKLDDALAAMDPDERHVWLERWVEIYVWMVHELMELHADPHPGNFLIDRDGMLVMLDFGCVRSMSPEFADGILEVLDTVWTNDPGRALDIYKRIGFGGESFEPGNFPHNLVSDYHDIVLTPFLRDEPFEFSSWRPANHSKSFMLKNPAFMVLTPPPEALMYFRVLSGIKGLLTKFDARINIYELSVAAARRRGVLTEI
jgi:predicted unusual protein kinase regulating ubiquinone biosynthesis (AarF/ABC1/UbiB family)